MQIFILFLQLSVPSSTPQNDYSSKYFYYFDNIIEQLASCKANNLFDFDYYEYSYTGLEKLQHKECRPPQNPPTHSFIDNDNKQFVSSCLDVSFGQVCYPDCKSTTLNTLQNYYQEQYLDQNNVYRHRCVVHCRNFDPPQFQINIAQPTCVQSCEYVQYDNICYKSCQDTSLPDCNTITYFLYETQQYDKLIQTCIPHKCPQNTYFDKTQSKCQFSCGDKYIYQNQCVDDCTQFQQQSFTVCLQNGTIIKKCTESCKDLNKYQLSILIPTCVDFCNNYYDKETNICYDSCQLISQLITYNSVEFISPISNITHKFCVKRCNFFDIDTIKLQFVKESNISNKCSIKCQEGQRITQFDDEYICILTDTCSATDIYFNAVEKDQQYKLDYQNNFGNIIKTCVKNCSDTEFKYHQSNQCSQECQLYYINQQGLKICTDSCPGNFKYQYIYKYTVNNKLYSTKQCTNDCSNKYFQYNDKINCYDYCESGYLYRSVCYPDCENSITQISNNEFIPVKIHINTFQTHQVCENMKVIQEIQLYKEVDHFVFKCKNYYDENLNCIELCVTNHFYFDYSSRRICIKNCDGFRKQQLIIEDKQIQCLDYNNMQPTQIIANFIDSNNNYVQKCDTDFITKINQEYRCTNVCEYFEQIIIDQQQYYLCISQQQCQKFKFNSYIRVRDVDTIQCYDKCTNQTPFLRYLQNYRQTPYCSDFCPAFYIEDETNQKICLEKLKCNNDQFKFNKTILLDTSIGVQQSIQCFNNCQQNNQIRKIDYQFNQLGELIQQEYCIDKQDCKSSLFYEFQNDLVCNNFDSCQQLAVHGVIEKFVKQTIFYKDNLKTNDNTYTICKYNCDNNEYFESYVCVSKCRSNYYIIINDEKKCIKKCDITNLTLLSEDLNNQMQCYNSMSNNTEIKCKYLIYNEKLKVNLCYSSYFEAGLYIYENGSALNSCDQYIYEKNNEYYCVDSCNKFNEYSINHNGNKTCLDQCQFYYKTIAVNNNKETVCYNQQKCDFLSINNECLDNCNGYKYSIQNTNLSIACSNYCRYTENPYYNSQTNTCVNLCDSEMYKMENNEFQCVNDCQKSTKYSNSTLSLCIDQYQDIILFSYNKEGYYYQNCKDQEKFYSNGDCVDQCATLSYIEIQSLRGIEWICITNQSNYKYKMFNQQYNSFQYLSSCLSSLQLDLKTNTCVSICDSKLFEFSDKHQQNVCIDVCTKQFVLLQQDKQYQCVSHCDPLIYSKDGNRCVANYINCSAFVNQDFSCISTCDLYINQQYCIPSCSQYNNYLVRGKKNNTCVSNCQETLYSPQSVNNQNVCSNQKALTIGLSIGFSILIVIVIVLLTVFLTRRKRKQVLLKKIETLKQIRQINGLTEKNSSTISFNVQIEKLKKQNSCDKLKISSDASLYFMDGVECNSRPRTAHVGELSSKPGLKPINSVFKIRKPIFSIDFTQKEDQE